MKSSTAAKASARITPELAAIVDELGALEKEYELALAPLKMKLPRMEALRKSLQAACPSPSDKEWVFEGQRFGAKLGPKAMVRQIDIPRLLKRIGQSEFVKFVAIVFAKYQSCGVSALSAEDVDDTVRESQTGARRVSTFEKGEINVRKA